MQCLVHMVDESELPPQAVTVFFLVIKETWFLHYTDWRLCIFCWQIQDGFHWVQLSAGLFGSGTIWNRSFGFLEGAHNRGLSSNPTVYTVSPSLEKDWPLVWLVVVHIICPSLFHSTLLYSIFFSSPKNVFEELNILIMFQ